jgi:hypothetical protein
MTYNKAITDVLEIVEAIEEGDGRKVFPFSEFKDKLRDLLTITETDMRKLEVIKADSLDRLKTDVNAFIAKHRINEIWIKHFSVKGVEYHYADIFYTDDDFHFEEKEV